MLRRNDPCPCGSGKKYKKCCQSQTEADSPTHGDARPAKLAGSPTQVEVSRLVALFNSGKFLETENQARTLLERYQDSSLAGFFWKVLGSALLSQGKDSLDALQKAADLSPGDPEANNTLGGVLRAFGRLDESLLSLHRAIALAPNYAEAHNNLGTTQKALGQLGRAQDSYRRAVELKPDLAEAHNNLGQLLSYLGLTEEAITSYRQAIAVKPSLYTALLFSINHSQELSGADIFAEHCRFGELVEAPLRAGWQQHTNSRVPERYLQIGFVSGDLNNHALASFIEPVLMHLADSVRLYLHAYVNSAKDDDVAQRLRGYFRQWLPIVGMSDKDLAARIRSDGIDILIDLSGHTDQNRLVAFAHKPAPVQISWMGYPGTTGLQAMDYYLSDRFLLPIGQFDKFFTEKIVRLPANAPFLPDKDAPEPGSLPALTNGYVTFGSFNRIGKIGREVVAVWAQLLRAVPRSRLLLGGMPEDETVDTLVASLLQEGIESERLSLHRRSVSSIYLALHQQVDICLDTFPYGGGTTTCHALWMGVPTLTIAGHTISGRTGAGILGHVGLEGFVARDATDFVKRGVFWSGNLDELSDIRTGLRERFTKSAAGQAEVVASGLERALRIMWQRWCSGMPPSSFDVTQPEPVALTLETSK